MPGIALHLLCAHRVVQRWRGERLAPPFCLEEPRLIEAFYSGAVGPDMGYFGGGGRRMSDLAHQVRSADLARALLQAARDPLEIAYAWGWVTHLLADVAVHPLINRATGELIHGRRERVVTAAECPTSHLRVELGLDAYIQARYPRMCRARFLTILPGPEVRFLAAAFRRIHGPVVHVAELVAARFAVLWFAPLVLTLNRAVASVRWRRRQHSTPAVTGAPPHGTGDVPRTAELAVVRGFLTPVRPRLWLVRDVARVVRGFAGNFLHHYNTGLRELPNHDLNTGSLPPQQP
jgi:hypothetical protein